MRAAVASRAVPSAALDRAIVARAGFYEFVRRAWPVATKTALIDGPHIRAVCEFLEEVSAGAIREFVIDVPPATGKSWIASVLWPAWRWTVDPRHRWICSSYSDRLVRRDSNRCRLLLSSRWYQERWGITVDLAAKNAETEWYTTGGGGRISATTGGPITGEHGHTFIVDDPLKPDEAHFDRAELGRVWSWLEDTVPTRLLDPATGAIGAIMQRLHQLDPAGRLIERGAAHLVLPMRFESKHPNRSGRDWRTEEGELLWPEGRSEAAVQQLENIMSPFAVAGQLQQRPAPEGGGIFHTEWLEHRWTRLPEKGVWLQSWDLAFKGEASSDDVAGGVWCAHEGFYDLVHQVRGKLSFVESVEAICQLADDWPLARTVLVEDKANGPAVIEMLRRMRPSLDIVPVEPQGGKEARAHATTRLWHGGRVRLPATQPWVDGYVAEHLVFPAGAQDGQVDQTSQALTYLSAEDSAGYDAMVRAWSARVRR